MRARWVYSSTVFCSILLIVSCGTSDWHPKPPESRDSKLTIELFYSASGNEQHYSATQTGAEAAQQTDVFQRVQRFVELEEIDEPDSIGEAIEKAREVSLNPNVLAVIGHSRSGTTHATLPLYAAAGIPVVMPSATSPYVLYRFNERETWPTADQLRQANGSQRFTNAFRLPPSDEVQVHAIELTANELTKGLGENKPKFMLICDTTRRNGSNIYTRPMCDSLRKDQEFSSRLASYREVDLDTGDIWGLVTEIHAVKPRYLVLLGYPELTRDVLEELKERAATPEQQMSNYTFITPDADLTDDLIAFGSNIYVTSPTNPERSVGCGSDLGKALSKAIQVKKKGRDPTEESYAFDAVLILATAVQDCAKPSRTLDRRCVMEYLEKPTPFAGACEEYHIDMGERQNARYYVYSICGNKFRPRWSVVAEEKELQDDSNWCKLSSH